MLKIAAAGVTALWAGILCTIPSRHAPRERVDVSGQRRRDDWTSPDPNERSGGSSKGGSARRTTGRTTAYSATTVTDMRPTMADTSMADTSGTVTDTVLLDTGRRGSETTTDMGRTGHSSHGASEVWNSPWDNANRPYRLFAYYHY